MSFTSPSIELIGSVRSENEVLFRDLRLVIKANQWTCLLGSSGIGKSTVLRLIAGLPTHVKLDGSIKSDDKLSISNRVSYMAQNDLLLPWASVSDNISLGSKLRGRKYSSEKKLKIIKKVGLQNHKEKYPFQLSGGQRQRTALARTLMENTPIVLLDEPFGSLDSNTREEMIDLTFKSLKGKTVLFVTHDPHEAARLCESIYILERQKTMNNKSLKPPFPKTYSDKSVFDLQHSLLEKIKSNHS